jgi:hypothetical protein
MYLSSFLQSLRRNGNIGLSNPKAINVGGGVGNRKGTKSTVRFVTRVKMTSLLMSRHRALAVHEKRRSNPVIQWEAE